MFQFEIGDHGAELNGNREGDVKGGPEFQVGDRIKCEKHSGVVGYVGEVSPHPGLWLGVEWDEPRRGKHNGSVEGVQYFQSHKPNAASFIRPHKAKRATDIVTALHERYGHDEAVMNQLKQIDDRMEKTRVTYR
jgi:dynactin complex subunit